MRSYISFAFTPTADTPGTALVLHFDQTRYIFGQICEGTQRAFMERGVSTKKVAGVFITGQTRWDNIGGMLGMILTLADSRAEAYKSKEALSRTKGGKDNPPPEKEGLEIWGAPNLYHAVACARKFVFRKGLPLKVHEIAEQGASGLDYAPAPILWDANVKIWSLAVSPASEKSVPVGAEVTTASPKSRKRSFEEANEEAKDETTLNSKPAGLSEETTEEQNQFRQLVVSKMFGSDWSLDSLQEIPLAELSTSVNKVWTREGGGKGLIAYDGPRPGGPEPLPDIRVLIRKPWPTQADAAMERLPPTTPSDVAMSYIVVPHARRGKFIKANALKYKLTPKLHYPKLTSGESVVDEDGVTVTPEMVLGESQQGAAIAIVDLPSDGHVKPFLERPELQNKEKFGHVAAIVWILGPGVGQNPNLRDYMQGTEKIQHIVASKDHCPNQLTFERATQTALNLATIEPDCYVVPRYDNTAVPQQTLGSINADVSPLPSNTLAAKPGLRVTLDPTFQLSTDTVVPFYDEATAREALPDEVASLAEKAHEEAMYNGELEKWSKTLSHPEAEIVTLGTGSALPSRYRNVSGTLIRVPGIGNYLLDCGENTLGQLQRMYSHAEFVDIMLNMRMIWISHLHADHHLGLVSLIKAWYLIRHGDGTIADPKVPAVSADMMGKLKGNGRITPNSSSHWSAAERYPYLGIVCGLPMAQYLSEYSGVENFGYSHILPMVPTFISHINEAKLTHTNTSLTIHHDAYNGPLSSFVYVRALGISNIIVCAVNHCNGARGVVLVWPRSMNQQAANIAGYRGNKVSNELSTGTHASRPPFKIAYSGDCRPSEDLARLARPATVLIHEATFDDDLKGDAIAKRHSTTSEALRIGALMHAKAVVLTHFSQRYGKIPGSTWGADPNAAETQVRTQQEEAVLHTDNAGAVASGSETVEQILMTPINENEHGTDEARLPHGSFGKELREPAEEASAPNDVVADDGVREEAMPDVGVGAGAEPADLQEAAASTAPELSSDTSMTDVDGEAPPNVLGNVNEVQLGQAEAEVDDAAPTSAEARDPQSSTNTADDAPLIDPIHENLRVTKNIEDVFDLNYKDMKVCVAFDYMRVKIKDIGRMELWRPALVKLFEEEEDDGKSDDESSERKDASKGEGKKKGKENGEGKGKKKGKGNAQGKEQEDKAAKQSEAAREGEMKTAAKEGEMERAAKEGEIERAAKEGEMESVKEEEKDDRNPHNADGTAEDSGERIFLPIGDDTVRQLQDVLMERLLFRLKAVAELPPGPALTKQLDLTLAIPQEAPSSLPTEERQLRSISLLAQALLPKVAAEVNDNIVARFVELERRLSNRPDRWASGQRIRRPMPPRKYAGRYTVQPGQLRVAGRQRLNIRRILSKGWGVSKRAESSELKGTRSEDLVEMKVWQPADPKPVTRLLGKPKMGAFKRRTSKLAESRVLRRKRAAGHTQQTTQTFQDLMSETVELMKQFRSPR